MEDLLCVIDSSSASSNALQNLRPLFGSLRAGAHPLATVVPHPAVAFGPPFKHASSQVSYEGFFFAVRFSRLSILFFSCQCPTLMYLESFSSFTSPPFHLLQEGKLVSWFFPQVFSFSRLVLTVPEIFPSNLTKPPFLSP